MTKLLVSYAQALEDIRLFQALPDVDPEQGFYIDIGANDPEVDSVTKLFYDQGWRGINVDASPKWAERLVERRPRDINLTTAVSDQEGAITFYDHKQGGLGTTVESIAVGHGASAVQFDMITTPATTLERICERHAPDTIHFLKIDVEGAERAVLAGMNFARYRPWLLCIESHYPNRLEVQLHDQWEWIVTRAGYQFAFTDMVNRYYVAEEQSHRSASFVFPTTFCIPLAVARDIQGLQDRLKACEQRLAAIKTLSELR